MMWFVMSTMMLVSTLVASDQALRSQKVDQPPIIDGKPDDPAWTNVPRLVTRDTVEGVSITARSVHTADMVYLLISFFDNTQSTTHKTYVWNAEQRRYQTGPKREDVFVVKWNMESHPVDLSLSANKPYKADIWYWKAHRTDHAGVADDKYHLYSSIPSDHAKKVLSKNGQIFYLSRPADAGAAAYKSLVHVEYEGDEAPKYKLMTPAGSRADVQAKGKWHQGRWTIEFARKLHTGFSDDVQFARDRLFQFGVSRQKIAGSSPNSRLDQPNYGCGEVGESLTLVFE
jgi:hypothetical protein